RAGDLVRPCGRDRSGDRAGATRLRCAARWLSGAGGAEILELEFFSLSRREGVPNRISGAGPHPITELVIGPATSGRTRWQSDLSRWGEVMLTPTRHLYFRSVAAYNPVASTHSNPLRARTSARASYGGTFAIQKHHAPQGAAGRGE